MSTDEDVGTVRPAFGHRGAQVLHVSFQRGDGWLAKRHHPLLAALTQATAESLAQIHIVDFQPSYFRSSGTAGVKRFEDSPVTQVELVISYRCGKQLGHTLGTEYRRQPFP